MDGLLEDDEDDDDDNDDDADDDDEEEEDDDEEDEDNAKLKYTSLHSSLTLEDVTGDGLNIEEVKKILDDEETEEIRETGEIGEIGVIGEKGDVEVLIDDFSDTAASPMKPDGGMSTSDSLIDSRVDVDDGEYRDNSDDIDAMNEEEERRRIVESRRRDE